MVNFGPNSASILGIFLAVAGASLYFIRTIRPELSRDHDIFFAAVGILCGLILLFQGWRLDPILQFGQFLLTGSAIFFAVESVRLRGIATEQARRNTPIVDEDRPVSKVYRAELDQLEPYDEVEDQYEDNRRLRGYNDPRSSRRSNYDAEEPKTSRNRRNPDNYGGNTTRESTRSRRPRSGNSSNPNYNERNDQWDNSTDSQDQWEQRPTGRVRPNTEESQSPSKSSRPNKKRQSPSYDSNRGYYEDEPGVPATDYVDYQPVDNSDTDNESDWEEKTTSERKRTREDNRDKPSADFDY